jgi:hypothetical protein
MAKFHVAGPIGDDGVQRCVGCRIIIAENCLEFGGWEPGHVLRETWPSNGSGLSHSLKDVGEPCEGVGVSKRESIGTPA